MNNDFTIGIIEAGINLIEELEIDTERTVKDIIRVKKETNTLYTINALNELIKKLNGGVVDTSYRVNWLHYKNSILLTQNNELNQLNTKIHQILEV